MIKLSGYFDRFSSRSDGSAGLSFSTQELTAEDFAILKDHHTKFGWILFKENDFSESDIPDSNAEEEGISPSERLRRRMYVYFMDKKIEGDFDTWRKQQLEAIGQKYLSRID